MGKEMAMALNQYFSRQTEKTKNRGVSRPRYETPEYEVNHYTTSFCHT